MTILGITGPTGAGKSLFSEYLTQQQIPVIDADAVYHRLLVPPSPCLTALRQAFGEAVFKSDGTLDRPALSQIVFHNAEQLALLNHTVLGFVLDEIRKQIAQAERDGKTSLIAVDAPTLIESRFHQECSFVISVLAPAELRTVRIMERDHLSREAAEARVRAQKDDAFYQAHSDFVLTNDGDREGFYQKCQALIRTLLSSPIDF